MSKCSLLLPALVCVGLVLPACKSMELERQVHPMAGLKVALVAVYPFEFQWNEPAYRSVELSQRLISVGLSERGNEVMFLGPSEFQVLHAQEERSWAGSDLLTQLSFTGVDPTHAVVVRSWAERLSESGQKDTVDARGNHVGSVHVEEVTYRGHLDIIHPSSGTKLAELSAQVRVDPFAPKGEDDSDPAPDLTHVMERLMREAMNILSSDLEHGCRPHALGFSSLFNPEVALESNSASPPLSAELGRVDPVEAEVLRINRIRFVNPGISDKDAATLARLPGGLWVSEVQHAPTLSQGDLITTVGEHAALPQTLERARCLAEGTTLRVRRVYGDWTVVRFP